MNNLLVFFEASGKMSGDGDMASVMGFSGFGMYNPAQIFNSCFAPVILLVK